MSIFVLWIFSSPVLNIVSSLWFSDNAGFVCWKWPLCMRISMFITKTKNKYRERDISVLLWASLYKTACESLALFYQHNNWQILNKKGHSQIVTPPDTHTWHFHRMDTIQSRGRPSQRRYCYVYYCVRCLTQTSRGWNSRMVPGTKRAQIFLYGSSS